MKINEISKNQKYFLFQKIRFKKSRSVKDIIENHSYLIQRYTDDLFNISENLRFYREKNISIPNQPKLIKNSSMKLLHFNSSYLNNLNSNQDDNNFKLSYNNYIDNKNNRLLSAGHFNNESENYYYNYINSQRTKKMSENNSIYKKHSHSDFSQIHQHF
jgi:hypothetical protein